MRFPVIGAIPCPSPWGVVPLPLSKCYRAGVRKKWGTKNILGVDGKIQSSAACNMPGPHKTIYHHSEFFSAGRSFPFVVTSLASLHQAWPGS